MLSAQAAEIWRDVLRDKPDGWFTADLGPLLQAYSDAVVGYQALSAHVTLALTPERLAARMGPAQLQWAMAAADKQARLVALLATRLRLTCQARLSPKAAAAASAARPGKKPWETGEDD